MDAQVRNQAQAYDTPEYWAGLIRMSLSKFFVLCALKHRPMHGYEITRSVSDLTGGCCAPTPGSLYPLLREFEQGGYVTCREETSHGRPRKVYTLTERGERAFALAVRAWTEVSACIEHSASEACRPGSCSAC